MAEEDTDSKRYEIAILQMRYEGQLLWQRFGAFFLLTDAIIQEAEDLDAHPRDDREAERAPKVNVTLTRWRAIPWEQRRLMGVFVGFLIGTLAILAIAIVCLGFVDSLRSSTRSIRIGIGIASLWLGMAPAYVVLQAAGGVSTLDQLRAYLSPLIQYTWSGLLTLVQAVRPGSANRHSSRTKSER